MVQASPVTGDALREIFSKVSFQKVPPMAEQGKPAAENAAVEELKALKGKPMSDNAKQVPAEVKAVVGKNAVKEPDQGFDGQMADGKKSGKAKQYWKDGSYFDGFMLEDNLCKGRFYFSNGDFYQGTFEDNQPKLGQYQQKGEPEFKCEQAPFVNGRPEGQMDKAKKITVKYNDKNVELIGAFKNGQPVGEQ